MVFDFFLIFFLLLFVFVFLVVGVVLVWFIIRKKDTRKMGEEKTKQKNIINSVGSLPDV